MEQVRLFRSGSRDRNRGYGSIRPGPTICTTLTLPLTRYTTRLFATDYRIFLGDYADLELDGDDDRPVPIGDNRCPYSKPILVLDLIWNLAFVLVALVVLLSTFTERPSTPLRLWLFGYAFQCVLHVGSVYNEFRRRSRDDYREDDYEFSLSYHQNRIVKKLESMNTMISSIWWVFGFYWIVVGGHALLQDCPRLYWLTVVFLAFDVFFIIFCIGMACIFFLALCFCVPIVAMAYAMTIKKGASEEDIRSLPKYRFRCSNSLAVTAMPDDNKNQDVRARMDFDTNNYATEVFLDPEDSECCICLSQYADGTELYCLPCNHHFHSGCISRWLQINATCPLCKSNILRGETLV